MEGEPFLLPSSTELAPAPTHTAPARCWAHDGWQSPQGNVWPRRSGEKHVKTSCCYHLLVQDLRPVHPGPHVRDVQLLVEGPVLRTQLRRAVVELLDAAGDKRQISAIKPRLLSHPFMPLASFSRGTRPGVLHPPGITTQEKAGKSCTEVRAVPSQLGNNSPLPIST